MLHATELEPRSSRTSTTVPHNRWDRLTVPELGTWTPTLRVSVVLPCYQAQTQLDVTLAALAAQTYPGVLTEVIVADDGSSPPIAVPDGHRGLDVRVVRQPRQGFGAARARNLGAAAATGDLLVFLDADMVPEPQHLEAHARWHHVCDHAVTIGVRRHVEFDGIGPDEVAEAATREGRLAGLFTDREQQVPTWIEGHLERTDDLRSAHDDLFRVVTSGNLGVDARLFAEVGGFDASFDRWGGEDIELGYRLFVGGGLLVPEPAALCWHQGQGHEPSEEEQVSLEQQRARLAHLIAHPGFRRARTGRSFLVPRVQVDVVVGERPAAEVIATVESVLGSDLHDLHVVLAVPDEHPDATWLRRQFAGDPRVLDTAAEVARAIPYRVQLPAGAVAEPHLLGRLVAMLSDPELPVGLIQLTVPKRRPREAHARAWSQRAAARVAFVGDAVGDGTLDMVADLFGSRWEPGSELGLRWHADDPTDEPVADAAPRRTKDDTQEVALELWHHLSRLRPEQQRAVVGAARTAFTVLGPRQLGVLLRLAQRLLLLLAAVAGFRRVRGWASLRTACARLAVALLPSRVVVRIRARRSRDGVGFPRDARTGSQR